MEEDSKENQFPEHALGTFLILEASDCIVKTINGQKP